MLYIEPKSGAPRRQWWRMWLVGRPLPTADAPHQAIGKTVGLAVFASDALSSTAYATQEILLVLALAGTAAFHHVFPISVAIVILLAIVTISYEQTIHAYPGGGGAYIVARDNLGELPAQIAGAARASRRKVWSRLAPQSCAERTTIRRRSTARPFVPTPPPSPPSSPARWCAGRWWDGSTMRA
jgi:hypothetical protein